MRWRALAIIVGATLFLIFHPISYLAPSSINWLLDRDAAAHFLGWQFYRSEPLTWPIGWIASYLHPIGASIGQTDSIPVMAMLLRPISSLLPVEAQYSGVWLFLCWIAQGAVAFRLLTRSDRPAGALQLIGAAFFVISPALVYRELMRHEALAAHAILLVAFVLYRSTWVSWRAPLLTALLLLFASLVHPYWIIMVAGVISAGVVRVFIDLGRAAAVRAAIGLVAGLVLAALGVWAVGYLAGDASQSAGGFGECATDVFAFANPMALSTFLRGFEVLPCRHEGYAYLGLGAVALIVLALRLVGRKTVRMRGISGVTAWPLWTAAVLMWIFALSSNITVFHVDVLDLSGLYALLEPLPSVLRSSGRFVWPIYYLVLWWALERAVADAANLKRTTAILVACFVLQAIDVGPGYVRRIEQWQKIESADGHRFWPSSVAPEGYRHLALYPPTFPGGPCESAYPNAFIVFGRLASVHRLTFNGGHTARQAREAVTAYCTRFAGELARGELARDTIYMFTEDPPGVALEHLRCATLDRVRTCVSRENDDAFARGLDP